MTRQDTHSLSDINQPFLGSHAVHAGLSPWRLRSRAFTKVFHNVYVPAHLPLTHELRCRAAALIAPGTATLTGGSAAAVHGYPFAEPFDPVEFLVAENGRFTAKRGVHIRRATIGPPESAPWRGVRLATPLRTAYDILRESQLRRSLPRAVAWLDVLLRDAFIDVAALSVFLQSRRDHGVIRARKALALADPRSESIPESEIRAWLRLGGLAPELKVGVLGFRLPLCFPRRRLAIEYEATPYDDTGPAGGDVWRRHRLRAEGWEIVIVTSDQLQRAPEGMVETVRDALLGRALRLAA